MTQTQVEHKDRMVARLAELGEPPARGAERAARGRAVFLGQAVSLAEARRHTGWKAILAARKERKMTTLVTVSLVLALLLGTGAAGAAAQGAMPGEPLYRVKLMTESLRYGLTDDAGARWQMMLQFSEQRNQEIRAMVHSGETPEDALLARYQLQMEEALRQAARLADDQAVPALEQIRNRLQQQDRELEALQAAAQQDNARLVQAREMVRIRAQWAQDGMDDPQSLRDTLQQRDQERQQDCPEGEACEPDQLRLRTGEPAPDEQPGQGPSEPGARGTQAGNTGEVPGGDSTPEPGDGYGPGSQNGPEYTPIPGSSYGPGPSATAQPEPGPNATEQPGPGPSATVQAEPGPNTTEQPGPGPQATMTHEPEGKPPDAPQKP